MVFANLPWLPYCVATRDASNLVGMALFTGLSLLAFVRFHVLGGELLVCGARPRLRGVLKSLPPPRAWDSPRYELVRRLI
jgi:hypothetical protein